MPVTKTAQLLATTLLLAFGTTAFAQDTAPAAPTTEAPATQAPATTPEAPATGTVATDAPGTEGLSMGKEPEGGPGSTYTEATFGTWEQRCIRTEEGADPCQLYHLLKDEAGNNVAEISIFGLPKGQQAAAGATIIVPLETLLTADLTLAIDSGKAKRYPYSWCSQIGCVARIGFTEAEVNSLKKGNAANLTIVPAVAPEEKVNLTVSLSGFTAGYDAVNKANGN